MRPQRYEAVNSIDDDEHGASPITSRPTRPTIPHSPPPSFRSHISSPGSRRLLSQDPLGNDVNQDMEDAFDDGSDSDADNDGDDRQRLMRADSRQFSVSSPQEPTHADSGLINTPQVERRVTELPSFTPGRSMNAPTNDGVFANLSAKPERGEQSEEKPPTYEQAAADATPPYWETTVLAPGMSTDEVYVDGLPVGSLFSFVWNGMISMTFELVGFLLTYLLHTTHAAKNGSRAGLGLTLIKYGWLAGQTRGDSGSGEGDPGQFNGSPDDPNSHNFDPNQVNGSGAAGAGGTTYLGLSGADWISYVLMIVGWFVLIRAVVDFLRVKRHERMVLDSPARGLSVPIIAEGETPEQTA